MSARIDIQQGVYDSPEISNKTNKDGNLSEADRKYLNESKQNVITTGETNVLNSYRSVTYNFTLAALENAKVNDPDTYRSSELNYIILKSGGKGTQGVTSKGASEKDVRLSEGETYDRFDAAVKRDARKNVEKADTISSIAAGFNAESPGRFDMFVENVEIETLMAPTPDSNATLATQIKFEVIEPFSVNGFLEALYTSSIAAGYSNYIAACYILKMEFWGYPDDDTSEFKGPVKIPKSDRYFPIGIVGIEVDLTERGTRYKVSAVPYNERAFGQPSKVKKPIKMSGVTVGEILKNLMTNINEQVKTSDEESKAEGVRTHDTYEVKFVNWAPDKGFYAEADGETDISKSKLTEIFKDNNLYTGDHKQIKCFHFVEGLGGRSDEEFDAIMKDFKYKWFNVDTVNFFKEQCGCQEFFN
jgi:hypothetical protein